MKLHSENPTFLLKPGEVHVWMFDLDDPGQGFLVWEQSLSEEERDRSKQYKFEIDRQRFVARRGLLRQLLGQYCRIAPGEIVYRTNRFGKLSLPSCPIRFNLSACQNRIALAFTLEKKIGVDIEQVRSLPELYRMAQEWFSVDESMEFFALATDKQLDAFYYTWNQKEAFVKAHGEGLSLPLQSFSVTVDPGLPGGILSISDDVEGVSAWKMITAAPDSGWRVAVCVQAEARQNIFWHAPILAEFNPLLSIQ